MISLPPMTQKEAEEKLRKRCGTCTGSDLHFAHKTAEGLCCLITFDRAEDDRYRYRLLMSDSTFEGAWYRLDREEAYQENWNRGAHLRLMENICADLLAKPEETKLTWRDRWRKIWHGIPSCAIEK